jgi:hypothetical protein
VFGIHYSYKSLLTMLFEERNFKFILKLKMNQKLGENVINQVLQTYDILKSYEDRNSKDYSLNAIKQGIVASSGLKISDIDKILYGNRLKTDKLNDVQKNWLTTIYNNYSDISVSQIAKNFSKSSGKKITTDYIYKTLYEMNNCGHNINWRGRPKSFNKNKGIENILEEVKITPEKKNLKKQTKNNYSPLFFNKIAKKAIAAGAIAAGLVIGTVFGLGINKISNNNYFQRTISLENQVVTSDLNENDLNNLPNTLSYANLKSNLGNFDSNSNSKNKLSYKQLIPVAKKGEVMMIKGGEVFPVKLGNFGKNMILDKKGFITLIRGSEIDYWKLH